MYKIGEFSKISHLTVKTLRYYEELGLIKPRTIDEFTGYRFYSADQLPRLQKIIALKQIGLSLADIAMLLKDDVGYDEMITRLKKTEVEIAANLVSEKNKLKHLQTYIATLKKEKTMEYPITVKNLPEVTVASMRKVIANYAEFNSFYPQMGNMMIKQKLQCTTPGYCFTLYHDKEHKTENIDVEICESVVKAGKDEGGMTFKKIPGVQAACTFHKGSYDTIGKAYASIVEWIEKNGYELAGLIRESYIDGIWNKPDSKDWLTEIQAPIKKKE